MHLDYDSLAAGQKIRRKTLEPGDDIQGQVKLTIPGTPADLSTTWTLIDPSLVDARVSGHTHTSGDTGMMINAGSLATGVAVPRFETRTSTTHGINFTDANTLKIQGVDRKTMVEFDLVKGTVDIAPDTNIQVAAEIFWHAVSNSNKGLVPRSEYNRMANMAADLRDELGRTQALLEKSLKALGDKYNEELVVSESVEF